MKDGRFEVGDFVIGNSRADGRYSITRNGWKGKVVNINKSNYDIKDCGNTIKVSGKGGSWDVCHQCFDLYVPSKSIIIKNVTVPTCCGECFAYDESGCKFCKVDTTKFNEWSDRAPNCPIEPADDTDML